MNRNTASQTTLMYVKRVLIVILLCPVPCLAQSDGGVWNEDSLLSAVQAVEVREQATVFKLLEQYKEFITSRFWMRLIEEANKEIDTGGSEQRAGSKKAEFLFAAAAKAAGQLGEQRLYAYTLYRLGSSRFAKEDFRRAVHLYLLSRRAFEESGHRHDLVYLLSDLGSLYIHADEYEKAKECSQQSLSIANQIRGDADVALTGAVPYGVATALSNLGNISRWEGEYDLALDYLKRSLTLFEQLSSETSRYKTDLADVLADIGRVYRVVGDNYLALHYLNQAKAIAGTLSRKVVLAGILNSTAILYIEQGDYARATDLLDQSLRIAVAEKDQVEIARISINMGVVNQRLGNYDEALKNFRSSLSEAEAIAAMDIIAAAQQGIGAVHQERGDHEAALEWLDKALKTAKSIGDKTRYAEILWLKSKLFHATGNAQEALASADAAVEFATRHRLPIISYLALTAKGKAYLLRGDRKAAQNSLTQAIAQVERLRNQVVGQEHAQQLFFENKVDPYHAMISLSLTENKATEALSYAEMAKGRVLSEVLRGGRSSIVKQMSSAERERERQLSRQIVKLNTQLGRENYREVPDDAQVAHLDTQLNKARLAYETFLTDLYASRPELKRQRGEFRLFDLRDAQLLVANQSQAILQYVVTNERTYLFVLARGTATDADAENIHLSVHTVEVTSRELANRVANFRKQLSARRFDFGGSAHQLYDLLIKPVEHQLLGKRTICVIPDGGLWELPFQALQHDARFLIEDAAIYYAPSLTVLREIRASAHERRQDKDATGNVTVEGSLLAFANPSLMDLSSEAQISKRGKKLLPLPETEEEARFAASVFGTTRSKVYVGREAREEHVKAEANRYRVLHFATHGLLDDMNPMYSRLVLAQGIGDEREDGLLEAREILNLDLRADLVILSACETGLGRFSAGEGVIGMTWAWFVAGAPATVASLWSVESASTSHLMVEFHRQFAAMKVQPSDVPAKASALRKAQLKLLTSEKFDHPFYWSGFSLFGDPR